METLGQCALFTAWHQIHIAVMSNSYELWNYEIHLSVIVLVPAQ